jgi:predicted RNA methylase
MSTDGLPGMESETRDMSRSQWFTDPKLAHAVWLWANRYHEAESVLEPAAGHGALIKPIYELPMQCSRVTAIDIDPSCVDVLEQFAGRARQRDGAWNVYRANFLASPAEFTVVTNEYDLVLMNPPYEDGQAEEFILRALQIAWRVVGIFKASIQHGHKRFHGLWSKAVVTREVKLARRPSFGIGKSGSEGGKTDFVVLEIVAALKHGDASGERIIRTETWP